jgi:hypothetical protein
MEIEMMTEIKEPVLDRIQFVSRFITSHNEFRYYRNREFKMSKNEILALKPRWLLVSTKSRSIFTDMIVTRDELIQLVKDITTPKGKTEEEINELIDLLEKNVPHPSVTDLIYFENLTAEEIVDKALSYKPFQL